MSSAQHVTVLYGSQTGNAQYIAESLSADALKRGLSSSVHPMNDFKKLATPLEQSAILVFVCSTTGNGDAPTNADKCWRFLKKRSQPKDLMSGTKFTVLGLGDTNYNKFCALGIGIDKRMRELGGEQFYALGCADEGTGLEDVVEPWLEGFWPALELLMTDAAASDGQVASEEAVVEEKKEVQEERVVDVESSASSTDDKANIFDQELSESQLIALEEEYTRSIVRDMGLELSAEAAQSGWVDDWEESEVSDLPRLSKIKTLVSVQAQAPEQTAVEDFDRWCGPVTTAFSAEEPPRVEKPAFATIASSKYLTKPASGNDYGFGERRVLHVELDLSNQGTQEVERTLGNYVPGDAVGVLAPNVPDFVGLLLTRLRRAFGTHPHSVCHMLETAPDDRFRQEQTLVQALKYRVDLQSTPRRKILRQLVEFCGSERDEKFLGRLCSKDAAHKAFQTLLLDTYQLRLGEIFALCPSICPPPEVLLSLLPPSMPRYYSIASSPLASKAPNGSGVSTKMTLAFSVVEYEIEVDIPGRVLAPLSAKNAVLRPSLRRRGLATSWFERVCNELGQGGQCPTLPLFLHPTREFVIPAHPKWPLLCIGPGTGVAPFIGFFEHRLLLEKRRREASEAACMGEWRGGVEIDLGLAEADVITQYTSREGVGKGWLAFGCRHRCTDFLYEDKIAELSAHGAIDKLFLAFSRDENKTTDADGGDKLPFKYVTHSLKAEATEVAKLLRVGCAYVYICGDGTQMAHDVHEALVACLQESFTCSPADLADLRHDAVVKDLYEKAHVPMHMAEEEVLEGLSEQEAQVFLETLMKRGRYVQDVW